MSPEEYITDVIVSLGEVENLELIRVIGGSNDPPPFQKGEFTPTEVQEWVGRNQESIVTSLLRVVDLGDEAVAYLHRLGALPIGREAFEGSLELTFSTALHSSPENGRFSLSDIAASSAALCELATAIAAANYAFGIESDPPTVRIASGSIQYTVGGSLLASGVGLVVACGAGLVAAGPIGIIGGGVLASAGVIELALNWRRSLAESSKLRSEASKLDSEGLKFKAEARKLDAEARKLEIEANEVNHAKEGIYQYRRPAYSRLVPRDLVSRQAEFSGLKEAYAHHILNRSLQKYSLIKEHFRSIHGSDLLALLLYLTDHGVEDPDVDVFVAVLQGDAEGIKRAAERGANLEVLPETIIGRHLDIFNR